MHNTDHVPEPCGDNSTVQNSISNNNITNSNSNNNSINNNNNNNITNSNNTNPSITNRTMGHSTVSPLTNVSGGVAPAVSSAPNSISASGGVVGGPGGSATGTRECAGCGKRIVERFLLKALDLFWHEDCLKCGCCDCRLGEVGNTLYTKANLILCKRDYLRLFGTTGYCAACNKVIPAFEMVMRAKSNVYHLECFACQQCNHRFCVDDRFYLCDNKILCEYDYEERLVFANMAYNPSSLAHIRRQVSNLQPAGDNMNCGIGGRGIPQQPTPPTNNPQLHRQPSTCFGDKIPIPLAPSNMGPHRDDGSSGYGSPDSETFESPQAQ